MRWKGSVITLSYLPNTGRWVVEQRDDKGWIEIKPLDNDSKTLANLSPTGRLWVRTRDVTQVPPQTETLRMDTP